jgi:hypothetical protein
LRVPTCTMEDIKGNIDNAFGDLRNFYNNNGSLDVNNY